MRPRPPRQSRPASVAGVFPNPSSPPDFSSPLAAPINSTIPTITVETVAVDATVPAIITPVTQVDSTESVGASQRDRPASAAPDFGRPLEEQVSWSVVKIINGVESSCHIEYISSASSRSGTPTIRMGIYESEKEEEKDMTTFQLYVEHQDKKSSPNAALG